MAELPERVEEELDRAKDALTDAQLLIEQGGSHSGAVNRLYYATFHAAQAVLYACGKNPTSHGQVRQQFGQYVVLASKATREEGRLLGKLYDYRLEADYGSGSPAVDLQENLRAVDSFVDMMSELAVDESAD